MKKKEFEIEIRTADELLADKSRSRDETKTEKNKFEKSKSETSVEDEEPLVKARTDTCKFEDSIIKKFSSGEQSKKGPRRINFILIAVCILAFVGASFAVSFASITGYATVKNPIYLDIIGSSDDTQYSLGTVYGGESVWSPKLKLVNNADTATRLNVSIQVVSGNPSDIAFEIWDENKTSKLQNPIELNKGYMYFYIKHIFSPSAEGNYSFKVDVLSATAP